MSEQFHLDKVRWSEADFDVMGWHDVSIHGIAFGPGDFELSLDIDYIFRWVQPAPDGETYRFWVSPCTLVFHNVHGVEFEGGPLNAELLQITELRRSDPREPKNREFVGRDIEWEWTIDCHNGSLSLRSVGFSQFVRRAPVLVQSQALDISERGGYSFDRGGESKHRTRGSQG